jgi:protein TonB
MTLPGIAAFPPLTPAEQRFVAGLLLSLALHLLIVVGITAAPPHTTVPAPLQVELRRLEAPPPATEAVSEAPSDFAAAAAAETPLEISPPPEAPPPAVAPEAPLTTDLPLDKYFTARELDVRAEPTNQVDLVYPVRAYEMRMHGRVVVRILINEEGAVDEVSVLEATPPGIFEEAALAATQALQFRPAQKYGRNVKSQKTIEVTFDPYESIRPR